MAVTEEQVRKIASLARLDLTDNEVMAMTTELTAIVAYVEQLSEVDTDSVSPIANVAGLSNVTRADEPGPMFTPKEALAGAPQANQFAFLVPKAVER